MDIQHITLNDETLNAKDLRAYLNDIAAKTEESGNLIITAQQVMDSEDALVYLGEPIYTTFLNTYNSNGMTISNHLYNLAVILDYLYLTEAIIKVDINDRVSIRCDRENFYVVESNDDASVPTKLSRVQDVTMDDLEEKFKLYYDSLTDLVFTDDIEDTKKVIINRLKARHENYKALYFNPLSPITLEQERLVSRAYETWINDIEKM